MATLGEITEAEEPPEAEEVAEVGAEYEEGEEDMAQEVCRPCRSNLEEEAVSYNHSKDHRPFNPH